MVYQGKPSKGCQTCKNRRIKCDEGRPACHHCKSTGRECPGYLAEVDLLFRHQTQAVRKKAQKALARRQKEALNDVDVYRLQALEYFTNVLLSLENDSADATESLPWGLPAQNEAVPNLLIPVATDNVTQPLPADDRLIPSPKPTVESLAIPFFFKHYVNVPRPPGVSRGYLEWFAPFWNSTSMSSPCQLAIIAASIAAFSKLPNHQYATGEAAAVYARALRASVTALSDPVLSKSNDTLLAIMILSLYESITSSQKTLFGFAKHIDGAIALIKHRGKAQFQDPVSMSLYRAVRSLTLVAAVQRARSLRDFPMEEDSDSIYQLPELYSEKFTKVSICVPDIRSRARELLRQPKHSSSTADVVQLLEESRIADIGLQNWQDNLPENLRWQVVATCTGELINVADADIWRGPVHAYADIHSASLINHSRIHRIYVQAIIIRCLEWLSPSSDTQLKGPDFDRPFTVTQQMVDDVCASVPFHFGFRSLNQAARANVKLEQRAADGAGGYFIAWPLYVAAGVESMPHEQRRWVYGRLKYVAKRFGLDHAKSFVAHKKPELI